jgi:hypothetical protein
LSSNIIESVVILTLTCCAVLVEAGAGNLGATIENTTARTTCVEEIAGGAVASQWVGSVLGAVE